MHFLVFLFSLVSLKSWFTPLKWLNLGCQKIKNSLKSLTITYCFMLLLAGLFIFSGSKVHVNKKESKNIAIEVSINETTKLFLNNNKTEKTNSASTQLESYSKLSFTDFNALLPQIEQRNHFRNNFRLSTYLKI